MDGDPNMTDFRELTGKHVVRYGITGRDGQDNPIRGALTSGTVIGVFPNGRIVVQISAGVDAPFTTEVWGKDDDWRAAP